MVELKTSSGNRSSSASRCRISVEDAAELDAGTATATATSPPTSAPLSLPTSSSTGGLESAAPFAFVFRRLFAVFWFVLASSSSMPTRFLPHPLPPPPRQPRGKKGSRPRAPPPLLRLGFPPPSSRPMSFRREQDYLGRVYLHNPITRRTDIADRLLGVSSLD